ncbi:hypothetical protein AVEN_253169-1 [Araneus ventricosus]|uniref:Uncharacterized protein n=1 Tax=Araneus ventricosus TaxID=182803 RepID=A0A4Y2HRR3_ARAVE|nr:hypothetical protein AVEN_253169-1 [Araneus ventricosus]
MEFTFLYLSEDFLAYGSRLGRDRDVQILLFGRRLPLQKGPASRLGRDRDVQILLFGRGLNSKKDLEVDWEETDMCRYYCLEVDFPPKSTLSISTLFGDRLLGRMAPGPTSLRVSCPCRTRKLSEEVCFSDEIRVIPTKTETNISRKKSTETETDDNRRQQNSRYYCAVIIKKLGLQILMYVPILDLSESEKIISHN